MHYVISKPLSCMLPQKCVLLAVWGRPTILCVEILNLASFIDGIFPCESSHPNSHTRGKPVDFFLASHHLYTLLTRVNIIGQETTHPKQLNALPR
jgi:hypothetical protein